VITAKPKLKQSSGAHMDMKYARVYLKTSLVICVRGGRRKFYIDHLLNNFSLNIYQVKSTTVLPFQSTCHYKSIDLTLFGSL